MSDQPNFVPLIDELNQLSNMYNRSISIRDANNKRKAQAGKENEGEEGDMGDDVPEMPEDKTPTEAESFRMTNTDFEDDLTDLETLGDFEEEY